MKIKLRWKLEPKTRGLASIGAPPRPSRLHDGEKTYAIVYGFGGAFSDKQSGWYWVSGWDSDVPYENTSSTPNSTEEEAKKQAKDFVEQYLKSEQNEQTI